MGVLEGEKRLWRRPCIVSSGVVPVYVVAVRVSRATLQSIASVRLAGSFSHLLFGEVIASNAALSGRAQVEAFLFVISRASLSSPRLLVRTIERLARLIASCTPGRVGSTSNATSWLAKQSLLMQFKTIGLHGSAVSAISATAVQIGFHGCILLKHSFTDPDIAAQQFSYDVVTALSSGAASLVGGSCGAVLGALVVPGVGTALGSFIGSFGGGYLPFLLRRNGPEARRERRRKATAEYRDFERTLEVVEDEEADWLILMDCVGEADSMSFDRMMGDDAEWLMELPTITNGGSAHCEQREDPRDERQESGAVANDSDEFVDFVDVGALE
ncbi:hypothetical protein TCSYLVIO_010691 [Trypanosoma cruzi]|nr:hypothetical protein TCSYLVIO_010691 [Trypanosoma cruzi]RNF23569.1 hypothetical protein TcG_01526 [Trypanosoma cruzi]